MLMIKNPTQLGACLKSCFCIIKSDFEIQVGSAVAGCGGVVRSNSGSWLVGFCKRLDSCNAHMAEEWRIFEGLHVAWEMGLKRVILESDANEVVQLILDS